MSDTENKLNITRRGMLGATATGAVLAGTGLGSTLMTAKQASAAANAASRAR